MMALEEAPDTRERLTVLVIDDDAAARYAVRKACHPDFYHVLEAEDAREGLHAARTQRPDLIVLDLNLPDSHGEEILRELADAPDTCTIPVVIVTAEQISLLQQNRLLQLAAAVLPKSEFNSGEFDRVLKFVGSRAAGPQRGLPS